MMFEVGRDYKIVTGAGENVSTLNYTVTEVDGPLIKLEGAGFVTIMNTNSPEFVSAQLDDEAARAAVKEEHERFLSSREGQAKAISRLAETDKLKAGYDRLNKGMV